MPAHRPRRTTPEPLRRRLVKVYVSPEEHAELVERAYRYAHGSVSAYVRGAALGKRMDPLPPPPPPINRDAYMSFTRVGALLNQGMHHLNSGNIWTTPQQLVSFRQQLAELAAVIDEVRRLLTRQT